MKYRQQGFTLIEIAIVLVIIGLLLGGILKGQELIDNARVKNLAADFKGIPVFIYGYQDRFHRLPGDDGEAAAHVAGGTACPTGGPYAATCAVNGNGNGSIDGRWDSQTITDESIMFWQHVRLPGFAPGETAPNLGTYIPHNASGGIIGIQSITATNATPITGMTGSYVVCSRGIVGKFAAQLDTSMDDGNTATGSMRVMADAPPPAVAGAPAVATATVTANAGNPYTVCMTF